MCAHLVAGMAPRKKGQYLNRTDLEEANRSSEFREAANIKLSVVTECGGFCCLLFLTPKLLTKFEAGKEKKKVLPWSLNFNSKQLISRRQEELNGKWHVPLFHLLRVEADQIMNAQMPHNFY